MRLLYIVTLTVETLAMLYVREHIRNRDDDELRSLHKLCVWTAVTVVFNILAVSAASEKMAIAAQGLYYAGTNIMLVRLYLFVREYTGFFQGIGRKKGYRLASQALYFADCVSMLLNYFFRHAFISKTVQLGSGLPFYSFTPVHASCFFTFHLIVGFACVAMSISLLVIKLRKVQTFYRVKYSLVLILLVLVILLDTGYIFLGTPLDMSLFLYVSMVMLLYHFTAVYIPRRVMGHTTRMMVSSMADGVFCFDMDGNCVYANDKAYELMGVSSEGRNSRKELSRKFLEWKTLCRGEYEEIPEQPYYSYYQSGQEKEHFYEVKKSVLDDGKEHKIGICYLVCDRTHDIETQNEEFYRASHDMLTDLYNREYFYEKVRTHLEKDPGEIYIMLCSDFKDFKLVNDLFGFEKGNEILHCYGRLLKKYAGPNIICGRLEDDHFAVCMRKNEFREEFFLEKISSISNLIENRIFQLQLYTGIYEITDPKLPVSVMCDRAHMAISTIKGDYMTKLAHYDESLMKTVIYEKTLAGEFDEALESGQFQIFLQPQTDKDGKVKGAEALVRWIHPERGMIPPNVFISFFERTGIITRLDRYVWELAGIKLKEWNEQGCEMYISVNISARDFYYTDVYENFTGVVEKYGISPSKLKLEITETALMMDFEKNLKILEKLQKYGFHVEIDDFGSGYSSLNMLKDIKADILKIDMMFLRKTENEERSRIILGMVIELAQKLGMSVLTEGVETKDQLDYLVEEGCDYFQGYYFAKPMPVCEFEDKYLN